MEREYDFISLGNNCFTRYILTKANLKPKKEDGELTMPFDLAVHLEKYIPDILLSDFSWYLNNIKWVEKDKAFTLQYKKSIFSKHKGFAWLNHDADIEKNAKKLKERYKKRIANFQNIIKKETPVIFVQFTNENYNQKLIDTLTSIRENKPFYMIFITTSECFINHNEKNISVIKSPYPYKEYGS